MVQALKKAVSAEKFAMSFPHLFTNLVVVGMFLYYQDKDRGHQSEQQSKEDLVVKQRIEQCHAVQAESNQVMRDVAEALKQQAIAFERLSIRLADNN